MSRLGNQTSIFLTCSPGERNLGYYINTSQVINSVLISVINSALSISGTLLNLTFIVTVLKNASLRTVPNMALLGLALNDLFTAAITMPLMVIFAAFLAVGKILCGLYSCLVLFLHTSLSVSYVLIVVISVEKYLAVNCPFWYDLHMTKTKLVSSSICLTFAVTLTTIVCFVLRQITVYNMIQSTLVLTAHVVFLFCQISVFRVILKIRRRIAIEQTVSNDNRELEKSKKKAYSLLYIVLSFILCYLPITAYAVYTYVNGRNQILYQFLLPWLHTVEFLSTTLSPLMYYLRLTEVRNKAKKMFSRGKVSVTNELPQGQLR